MKTGLADFLNRHDSFELWDVYRAAYCKNRPKTIEESTIKGIMASLSISEMKFSRRHTPEHFGPEQNCLAKINGIKISIFYGARIIFKVMESYRNILGGLSKEQALALIPPIEKELLSLMKNSSIAWGLSPDLRFGGPNGKYYDYEAEKCRCKIIVLLAISAKVSTVDYMIGISSLLSFWSLLRISHKRKSPHFRIDQSIFGELPKILIQTKHFFI